MKEYKSFLIINPFGIGDVLFSTPLIENLKQAYPSSTIYYLCNKRTAGFLKNNPRIKKVFVYERDDFEKVKKESFFKYLKLYQNFIREIKKEKIQVAVDLSLNSQYGFLASMAGIKKRIGLEYKKRGMFLTNKIKIEGFENKHVIEFYLDVLKLIDVGIKTREMKLFVDKESRDWADNFLSEKHISLSEKIVGIVACGGQTYGDNASIKWWDKDNFAQLITNIISFYRAKVLIFCSKAEEGYCKELLEKIDGNRYCHLIVQEPLEKVLALVERCSLVVGNDTGIVKFADALGRKVIEIFGPVDDKVYGIYPPAKNKVIMAKNLDCRPCYRRFRLAKCDKNKQCLTDITADEVMFHVQKMINFD